MKEAIKKYRVIVIITVIILIAAAAVGIFAVLKKRDLEREQISFVEELQAKTGTYDEKTIVLKDTNEHEAKKLAERFGARLRISKNGHFAVLYLPEDKTIVDICSDDSNREYISAISPDYYARIADAEYDEEEITVHMPSPPNYDVPDPYFKQQSSLNYINIGDAWYYMGSGIKVAIIDTGIDTDHPEFAGRISEYSYNAVEDKIVADNSHDWSLIEDENGHGTQVAGVLAAAMNGEGVTGIAPEVEIVVIKASTGTSEEFKTSDLVFGLYYAVEANVDVINMSFEVFFENPFADAASLALESDIICIAAAGNEGVCGPWYPAADPNVISVSALAEGSWELGDYSNYGMSLSVCAPGNAFTTTIGGKYKTVKGTSFATPMVSAAAALFKGRNPYSTNEAFIDRLRASCYDLGEPGPDYYYGFGALDVNALLCEPVGKVKLNMLADDLEDEEKIYIVDHALMDIPEPERLYAVFDGWYYDPECTDELDWYKDIFSSKTMVLYAKWANEDDIIPFDYKILEDGTVEITGYKGKRRYITVPNYIEGRQVSSIGNSAFAGNARLRGVTLPRYLKQIGDRAFFKCENLLSINIPDEVTVIGGYAFSINPRLLSVTIGRSVRTVGGFAFSDCPLLTSLSFPDTLEQIDGSAFYNDTSLLNIHVDEKNRNFISPDGVLYNYSKSKIVAYPAARSVPYALFDETKTVGSMAFACSKTPYVDLKYIIEIEARGFSGASLITVTIPDTCVNMQYNAFASNNYLSSVRLSNSLTEIADGAFGGTPMLKSITIPAGIRSIGAGAFVSGLENIIFESNENLTYIGSSAFAGIPAETVTLPESVVTIMGGNELGNGAFEGCERLRTVDFGENSVLQYLGGRTFFGVKYLHEIELPDTLRTIDYRCFAETSALDHIEIPRNVTKIGSECFYESGLSGTVVLPASLKELGSGAFAECHKLISIDVNEENAVYKDVNGAVYTKDGHSFIEYPAGNAASAYTVESGTAVIFDLAFEGAYNLERIELQNGVTHIYSRAFADCKYVSEYSLPDTLEYIGKYAFYQNNALTYIGLPDSVTRIDEFAFAETRILDTVGISENSEMIRIGLHAFARSGITHIRIPSNVARIAQYAFEDCTRLREVTFARDSQLRVITAYLFKGCNTINTVIFESGAQITSIQAHGFDGMKNLSHIDFGGSVIENIDNYAFRQCLNLETIELSEGLKSIGRFAFYKCERLRPLTIPESTEHIGENAFLMTNDMELYFRSEMLPMYLDDNWDSDVKAYFTGTSEIVETENWKYAVLKNGTVSIIEYLGSDKNIDLANFEGGPVSVISGYAFSAKKIESIILPETLTQIQRYAFSDNRELSSVTVPASVKLIAHHAFCNTGIQSLTFCGDGPEVIEQYAFAYTRSLSAVTLPSGLQKLGRYAFFCSGINSIDFADGYSINAIPEAAFSETKIASLVLPDCVTEIGKNAFSHIKELKTVDFGAGEDIMILSSAFYNSGLESVEIGKNIKHIEEYAFTALKNLTEFSVDPENGYYTSENGILFNKAKTSLITVPAGKTGSYMIPNYVEKLGFGAFEESAMSGITFEENTKLVTIGWRAFYGMKNLTEIEIPASIVSIDFYGFAECSALETVTFETGTKIAGIYEGAFFGCRSLKNIMIPDSIVEISDYTFYACESLDYLPLSDTTGVLGIYDYAFAYTSITDLDLPDGLRDIGAYAFCGIRIKDLVIQPPEVKAITIGLGAFAECNELENVTVPFTGEKYNGGDNYWFGFIFGSGYSLYDPEFVPESVKNITVTHQYEYNKNCLGSLATKPGAGRNFYKLPYVETVKLPEETYWIGVETFMSFSSLKTFDMPAEVEVIDSGAFYECSSLEYIEFSPVLEKIGESAFKFCSSLNIGPFPDGLRLIDSQAFCECVSIEHIDVPASVEKIGYYAFVGCSSLKTARLNASLIGVASFKDCIALQTVELDRGLDRVMDEAFCGCRALKNIRIADTLTYIGERAFYECENLEVDIVIPEGVTEVGERAFAESGIVSISIPGTLSKWGEAAFYSKRLKTLVINEGVEVIPRYAFDKRTTLKTVILPDSLKEIKTGAFSNCNNLSECRISENSNLQRIGERAFYGCSDLYAITLPKNLERIDEDAFGRCGITQIYNYSELPIMIPDGTGTTEDFGAVAANVYILYDQNGKHVRELQDKIIDEEGFVYQPYDGIVGYVGDLDEITLPIDKPISYNFSVFYKPMSIIIPEGFEEMPIYFGRFATKLTLPASFKGYEGLNITDNVEEITVAEGNEHIIFENGMLVINGKLTWARSDVHGDIVIPNGTKEIAGNLFNDKRITSVSFPDTLEIIGDWAFSNNPINRIILPDSVKTIGESAFQNCNYLTVLDLGSVETIGSKAFHSCFAISDLFIPKTLKTIGDYAFYNCYGLENLVFEEGFETISNGMFSGCSGELKSVIIPSSVTSIGYEAFAGMENLKTVVIGENVSSIGSRAFGGCKQLKSLRIPASVTYIGSSAFPFVEEVIIDDGNTEFSIIDGVVYNADRTRIVWISKDVKCVTLPDGITRVENELLADYENIEKVIIPDTVTEIGVDAFRGCRSLKEIVMPSALNRIEYEAFAECESLETILIPNTVTEIGVRAFSGCKSLKEIMLPSALKRIEQGAFSGCESLKTLYLPEGLEYIGNDAFSNTAIEYMTIPSTVTWMWTPFGYSESLKEVTLAEGIQGFQLVDGVLYNETSALGVLPYATETVRIPEGIERLLDIKLSAKTIYIPSTLGPYGYGYNDYTFDQDRDSRIEEFIVSPDNPYLFSYDGVIYDKETCEILFTPTGTKKKVLHLPDGIKEIKSKGWNNTSIEEVVLPESVEKIGKNAFSTMWGLKRIVIPESVTEIDDSAFYGCENLHFIYNESDLVFEPQSDSYGGITKYARYLENKGVPAEIVVDGWRYFAVNDYLYSEYVAEITGYEAEDVSDIRLHEYFGFDTEITLPAAYNGKSLRYYKFYSSTAKSITVPEGVTELPAEAFADNGTVEHVYLPESLIDIGESAFSRCVSLKSIRIPHKIQEIRYSTFYQCFALENVELPDGLLMIDGDSFCSCINLTNIIIPESVNSLGYSAFGGAGTGKGVFTIELPPYLQTIEGWCFYGSALKSITVPASVRNIGEGAFLWCHDLTDVRLPDTGLIIGKDAFLEMGISEDESRWDGDFLYIGNHLIRYRGNDTFVCVERDVYSICTNAFEGCFNTRYLEISGNGVGIAVKDYLPSLITLIARKSYSSTISQCFENEWGWPETPASLKSVILKASYGVDDPYEFCKLNDIMIYVEGTREECPWDRLAPGWNNGNIVTYGDKWYSGEFYDEKGELISFDCFGTSHVIRPPYVMLPRSGDTAYTHIGWDLDGDGEPDGMPASRLSDVVAHAVVTTSKPAYYTVKFMDMDRKTVIEQHTLEFGMTIPQPASVPVKQGYTFIGWENYDEDMTINTNMKIYSVWKHDGDGHNFIETIVPPNCTEKGYTLHKCGICGEEYKTDIVDELWHTFGDWITDTEPTCAEHGDRHRICEVCGFEENAILETLGHNYVGSVIKESSCTENGVIKFTCSECGAERQEAIPLQPHDYQKVYADKDYIEWLDEEFSGIIWGCSEDKTEYWYYTCSHCGKIQVVETASAASAGAGHKHVYAALLNGDGKAVAVRCTLCGEVICHEHDYECLGEEEDGTHYRCVNCGHEYVEQAVTYGDANGDGKIDGRDIIRLRKYLASYDSETGTSDVVIGLGADCNGDGKIDGRDLIRLRKYLASYDEDTGTSPVTLGPETPNSSNELQVYISVDKKLLCLLHT